METKFYTGSYTLTIGQPYVIISVEDRGHDFFAEKVVIFEGTKGIDFSGKYIAHSKILFNTINDVFNSELKVCKHHIFKEILYEKYNDYLEKKGFDITIELNEKDDSLISLLNKKFPTQLEEIKKYTSDPELKRLIELHQSI